MSTSPPAHGPLHALLRPRVVFPTLVVLVVLSVLLTPQDAPTDSEPALTTHSTGAQGASGLAEAAERLGWRVSRLTEPPSDTLATNAIYAVLVSDRAIGESEAHTLLDRVRAGASLLAIVGGGAIGDSLHVDAGLYSGTFSPRPDDTMGCAVERRSLRNLATILPLTLTAVSYKGVRPRDAVHLGTLNAGSITDRDSSRGTWPAVVGIPLGRGRVVVIADARLLTNNVLRVCRWGAGVAAVRAIEWLAARDGQPPLATIVFDEFHHGYGRHPSTRRAVVAWLTRTTSGRMAAQLLVAALILLAVRAPRPLPPLARTSVARRSPLEHVSALAQAYEQVRATRTAARLLVQGLRRRLTRVAPVRRIPDEEYLASLVAHDASVATQATRVRNAMTHPVPAAELLNVAQAIDRIERSVRS